MAYDFVIAGGGSAASLAAMRLVRDFGCISGTTTDFQRAAQGLGHACSPDFNGARQNGVGIMQHTSGQGGRYRERSDPKSARNCSPGPALTDEAELARFAGQTVKTNYHPVGTARTGHEADQPRWSMRISGCAASRACASSTVPSCRRSSPATPMPPPWPSAAKLPN